MTLDSLPPRYSAYLPVIGGGYTVMRYRLQMAAVITRAGWQQRPRMEQHATLMQVAQDRALFLANVADINAVQDNHSFSEDERSPNAWLTDAGYPLPDWYSTDANNVESYATGQRSVDEAIDAWLASDAHREHVAGEGEFYGGQIWFGVGVELNGRYSPAYVLITSH